MNGEKTILEQEKKQKMLLFVFVVIIFVTGLILWKGYFKPASSEEVSIPEFLEKKREIKIDLEVLDHPLWKDLKPLPEISPPSKEEIGKENPFLP